LPRAFRYISSVCAALPHSPAATDFQILFKIVSEIVPKTVSAAIV
jgi:hypothetical protein